MSRYETRSTLPLPASDEELLWDPELRTYALASKISPERLERLRALEQARKGTR